MAPKTRGPRGAPPVKRSAKETAQRRGQAAAQVSSQRVYQVGVTNTTEGTTADIYEDYPAAIARYRRAEAEMEDAIQYIEARRAAVEAKRILAQEKESEALGRG